MTTTTGRRRRMTQRGGHGSAVSRRARAAAGAGGAGRRPGRGAGGGGAAGRRRRPSRRAGHRLVHAQQLNTPERPEGLTRVALLEEFTKTNTQKVSVDVGGEGGGGQRQAEGAGRRDAGPVLGALLLSGRVLRRRDHGGRGRRAEGGPGVGEAARGHLPGDPGVRAVDGQADQLPGYTNNQAMIYNTGLLQQAGVPAPGRGGRGTTSGPRRSGSSAQGMLPLSMGWGT